MEGSWAYKSQPRGRGLGTVVIVLNILFLVSVSCSDIPTEGENKIWEDILPRFRCAQMNPIRSVSEESCALEDEELCRHGSCSMEGYCESSQGRDAMTHRSANEETEDLFDLEKFGIMASSLSDISVETISVEDFGAKGDGRTDDTEAFEKAWKEACSSAPSIFYVPQGKSYLVKPITFSGPCQTGLNVQISGTIVAPEDPGVWDGLNSRLWLHFHGMDDLTVEGGGTVDGSGHNWWARSCKVNKKNPCSSAPTALTFASINNLRLRDLSVENSQQMHVSFQKCVGVQASNLRVTAPWNSPNTDGIHVTASKYVVIKNTVIGTGDDCISIVSDSVNIRAQNITCGPGHGISIGSLGQGNSEAHVSGVMVDGASLHDTTNGLRIKTWQGGSGFARGITFRNVHMDNVSHPIIIDQYYCDSNKPCEKQESAVKVSNVLYKNIRGTTATKVAVKFACSESVPCQGIVLQNIHLTLINSESTPTSYCEAVKGSSKGKVIPPPCF